MKNNKAREYTSPLIEQLLNEVTQEEIEKAKLENVLLNAIVYGVREITGHTIGDKIALVIVDEFLDEFLDV
jgi:hypothetical protein